MSVDELFEQIAQECFGIDTLESRNRDHLDFYEVSVRQIKKALDKAYIAGANAVLFNRESK